MKFVTVFLRYDYGDKNRGDSLEYRNWYLGLKELGVDVFPFWYDEYLRNNKKQELQRDVKSFVDGVNPDLVFFILMKNEFSFETLDYLKNRYVTVNWFCDDQWRFDSFTRFFAPYFSICLTTDKFAISKYKGIGCDRVFLVPPASFMLDKNIDFDNIDYEFDVSFVGGWSRYRQWVINKLLKHGIHVECFGSGWGNGRVSFERMAEIFKTSRVNLNISNSVSFDIRFVFSGVKNFGFFMRKLLDDGGKFAEQIKGRNFEIPSLGGFQLTNYVPGLEDYLTIGEEVATYSSVDELALKIKYYLEDEYGVLERKEIMVNGYKRALEDDFTFTHRLKEIFKKTGIKL